MHVMSKVISHTMKKHPSIIALLLLLCLLPTLKAQKTVSQYAPDALFSQGLVLFQNGSYAAAMESFNSFLATVDDPKLQKSVDAQYYIAVSSLYAGHADAEAKIKALEKKNNYIIQNYDYYTVYGKRKEKK